MKCLIPILLVLPFLSGCDMVENLVEPELTPEQQTRLGELEVENAALEEALAVERVAGLEAVKTADAALAETTLLRMQKLLGEQAAVSDEAREILASSPTKLTGFMKFAGSIPGPWQALIPFAGTILTTMLGRRSRKWAWITAKNALSVGLLDTLKNLGRTVGSIHSSESSEAAAVADPDSLLTA